MKIFISNKFYTFSLDFLRSIREWWLLTWVFEKPDMLPRALELAESCSFWIASFTINDFCPKLLSIYPPPEFRGPPIWGPFRPRIALAIPFWLPRTDSQTLDPDTSKADQTVGEWEHVAEIPGFYVFLMSFGDFRSKGSQPGLMTGG